MSEVASWLKPAVEAASAEISGIARDEHSTAEGRAFAVWALTVVQDTLTLDEAWEATETLQDGPGDGGIDGWWVSENDTEAVVLQAKYSERPLESTMGPAVVREFVSSVNQLLHGSPEKLGPFRSDAQVTLRRVLERRGTIRLVLAGWQLTSGATETVASELGGMLDEGINLELWNISKLCEQWSITASDEDLAGQPFEVKTTTEWVDMPGERPPGVTSAGVISLDALSLVESLDQKALQAISANVRHHLGSRGAINRRIVQTIKNEREKFWLLNNGMTVLVDRVSPGTDGKSLVLINPQIVNGAQTLYSLIAARDTLREGSTSVLARVVELDRGGAEKQASEIAAEISESTNRQNKISTADLRANDDEQRRLERALRKAQPPWFYERKRNARSTLDRRSRSEFAGIITKDELGQHWRAFSGEPAGAIKAKGKMYEDTEAGNELYSTVFDPNRDIYEFVLAHILFRHFVENVPKLQKHTTVLARAQNLWAAHCTALVGELLRESGIHDYKNIVAERESASFYELCRLVETIGETWLTGRIQESTRDGETLQVKNAFEKSAVLSEWMDLANTLGPALGVQSRVSKLGLRG